MATSITPTPTSRNWLDYRHKLYAAKVERWNYIRDAYTGELLESSKIRNYLKRRVLGEAEQNFNERCDLADYPTHMGLIIHSLAGMLSHADDAANRIYNLAGTDGKIITILGDPEDRASIIGKLYSNADGQGRGWKTVHKQLASDLTAYHYMWGLVDPGPDREARIRYLPPMSVPNWLDGPTGPTAVLVAEEADTRGSLEEDPETHTESRFIRYGLNGWQRFRKTKEGAVEALTGAGNEGNYRYLGPNGQPILPIYPVLLPLAYEAGYLLARRVVALFNKKSERDNLLRIANMPRFCIPGPETHFNKVTDALSKGANAVHELPGEQGGQCHYEAPDTSSAEASTQVLDKDTRDIYITAYREYNDAAAQRTAQEVKQDLNSREGAFLQLLAGALDDAETQGLIRITQQQLPGDANRRKWFVPHVERSSEFIPKDPEAEMARSAERTFGKGTPIPVGTTGRLAVAKQISAYQGIETNESEVRAEIEIRSLMEMLERAQKAGLPIPADLRVQAMLRIAAVTGVIDPKAAEAAIAKLEGNSIEQLIEQMREIALADDARRQLEAQHFGGSVFSGSEVLDDEEKDDLEKEGGAGKGA